MEPVLQHCTNVLMGVPEQDLLCLQSLKNSEQKPKEENSMIKKPLKKPLLIEGGKKLPKKSVFNLGSPRRTLLTSSKVTE